jgi:hypothetical protein
MQIMLLLLAGSLSIGHSRRFKQDAEIRSLVGFLMASGISPQTRIIHRKNTEQQLFNRYPQNKGQTWNRQFAQPLRRQAKSDMQHELTQLWKDFCSDDWQPLGMKGKPLQNPCFLSSFLCAVSVFDSMRRNIFMPFGF